jgi:hypothetical protein
MGGRQIFVLNSGSRSAGAYRVGGDGSLIPVDTLGGLPAGATGLAAG